MTQLMEKAIDIIRNLPDQRQDELAAALFAAIGSDDVALSAAEEASVQEGLADAKAGRFASQLEVDAIFARHRRA